MVLRSFIFFKTVISFYLHYLYTFVLYGLFRLSDSFLHHLVRKNKDQFTLYISSRTGISFCMHYIHFLYSTVYTLVLSGLFYYPDWFLHQFVRKKRIECITKDYYQSNTYITISDTMQSYFIQELPHHIVVFYSAQVYIR